MRHRSRPTSFRFACLSFALAAIALASSACTGLAGGTIPVFSDPISVRAAVPTLHAGTPGPTRGMVTVYQPDIAGASDAVVDGAPTDSAIEPVPDATAVATPTLAPSPIARSTSLDYYRYQGAADSGECNESNCGPTAVAEAISYATGDTVPIKEVRAVISGDNCRGTDYSDARSALDHWKIQYESIYGMEALKEALNTRGHLVLVILKMSYISEAKDYLAAGSDPVDHFDRYHSYTYGHFVVAKKITDDGKWVVVDDPYVFDEFPTGSYSDGSPKGRDRYYSYPEFELAYQYYGWEGIEIIPQ
jgi:hypothetical protein